ncbi:MAG: N-acetyltransferase [Proteobacteria bacterium]|nr:MAG: N-acetyltransferase [Pseudomonadota bacterium]
MSRIQSRDVTVREFCREDYQDFYDYFVNSPPLFLNSIGMKAFTPERTKQFDDQWLKRLDAREAGGSPIPVMTVFYRGERIGFHTTTHHEPGKSLMLHAHFFRADLRGVGIGIVSGTLATERFLTEYGYKEVLFHVPKRNLAPIRVMEKSGLECLGETVFDSPVLIEPMPALIYRATIDNLPAAKKAAGLE